MLACSAFLSGVGVGGVGVGGCGGTAAPSVSSLFPRLGRISEESGEFFERVNGVLQKQQNMLQAAQAEVTSARCHASIWHLFQAPAPTPSASRGGGGVKLDFLTFLGGFVAVSERGHRRATARRARGPAFYNGQNQPDGGAPPHSRSLNVPIKSPHPLCAAVQT